MKDVHIKDKGQVDQPLGPGIAKDLQKGLVREHPKPKRKRKN